ncbi:MAG: COR domain-containing protein [Methylobacter sp.]
MQPLWSQTIPNAWQNKLANFKSDALNLDAGFEVWQDWYDERLLGNPIDLELLKNWNRVPSEIASQSVAEVNAYIKNLKDKVATQPLNRVRAIFIGYGEAGKTSLVRALHDEPVIVGKELMTPGIDIRDWPVPDSDIQAHFWDFGGQVMAHSTHQFFLRSSCLYVLVLNARNEINGTEQAEYWLEHVKGFGNNAPVMIVGNKSDLASINLDMSYLKSKYPNIVDFYPVSCTQAKTHYKSDFDRFKRDFCQKLQEVGTHQMLFTEHQFSVLEALRQCSAKDAFLKHHEFENICTQYGIGTEGVQNREWLLDILDKLGVVIHFPQLAFLDDYVLNPRWLTYGVYTLMYSKQAKLDEFQIIRFLNLQQITDEAGNKLDYPKDKCRFIMEAMKEFKLCYPLLGDRNTLIIPELLPTDQPEVIRFEKAGALAFEFVFRGFLPRHVMPELIVNRHEEIVQQIVWQRGVLLKHKISHAQALIQVDYHERVLSIWVNGRDARDYLGLLNDEVLKILKRLDLDYKEWITLPLSACISHRSPTEAEEKAPYRQILACARKGERAYISETGLEYNLNQVLGIILSNDEQERAGVTQIFNGDIGEINVSKQSIKIGDQNRIDGSVVITEKIENSFNNLQASKANNEVNILLEQLLTEIKALNGKVPNSQTQQFVDMAESAETLITETGREAPRPKWYQLSLEGIKEAALAVGKVAKPVLEIAEKLAPLLQ